MSDKKYGFWTRLTQSSEDYEQSIRDGVQKYIEDNREYINTIIESHSEKYLENRDKVEAEAKLKQLKDIEDAEQARIKEHINSREPWFEVIDYRGDLSDVSNYRWNQSFIDHTSIQLGIHGQGAKEVFKRFLANREYQSRLSIIQEERDKNLDNPEPWFEWTVKGISDEGYPVHMEWNPAFIRHLNEQGFTGRNEDEIVKLWLTRMIRFTPQSETHE